MFAFGLTIVLLYLVAAISGLIWFILLIESLGGSTMTPEHAKGFLTSSGLIALTVITIALGINLVSYYNEVTQVSDDTTVEIVDESLGVCP